MRRRFVFSVLVVVTIGVVLAVALPIVFGIRSSLRAEKTLHTYNLVLDLIENYVETHSGSWPNSWEQLEQVAPKDHPLVWRWPDDKKEIESRIHVDFSLTSGDVVKMSADTFTAVTQKGPYYEPNKGRINQLLEIVRSTLPTTK